MEWVTIDKTRIVEALASNVRQLYEGWVVQNPDKAARIDDIIANLVMEFRAGIEANPLNTLDADTAKLPQSCVRHCETLIIFDICCEIGAQVDTADAVAIAKAEIFLRQMFVGKFYLTGGEAVLAATPSYGEADARPARTL